MTAPGRLPEIAPGVELAEFDTEIVALVPGRRTAVHLDAAHAVVLDSCRRGDDVERLVDDVAQAADRDRPAIRAWVGDVLQEFARIGLVTVTTDE